MSSTATEMPTRLRTHSRHTISQWAQPVSEITGTAWLNDAVATAEVAEPRPLPEVELRIYKLVKDEDGQWECRVVGIRIKPKAFAATAQTKLGGRIDLTDASLLDDYMRGDGPGTRLRESDAARLLAVWANTVDPTPAAARSAAIGLTIRAAITRGCQLEGYEAVV